MRNQHPLATWAREQARRLFYLSKLSYFSVPDLNHQDLRNGDEDNAHQNKARQLRGPI